MSPKSPPVHVLGALALSPGDGFLGLALPQSRPSTEPGEAPGAGALVLTGCVVLPDATGRGGGRWTQQGPAQPSAPSTGRPRVQPRGAVTQGPVAVKVPDTLHLYFNLSFPRLRF